MPISTYLKEWKNKFIFISPNMLHEPLVPRDPSTAIEDDVPSVSVACDPLWKLMCENPTRAFNFPEGILVMGGVSPLSPRRPKAILDGGDAKGVVFVYEDEDGDLVEDPKVNAVPDSGTPFPKGSTYQVSEGSHTYPRVENVSCGEDEPAVPLSHKPKSDSVAITDVEKHVPRSRNIRSCLCSASNQESQPLSRTVLEAPHVVGKASLSKHLKVSRLFVSLTMKPASVSHLYFLCFIAGCTCVVLLTSS
ncbi:hypothetical protein HanPI659440_Chr04g0156221 [Helianthus annuus]|nr:hypothetical protein HanPI659440_Chr04g0156221 [Helianthus annuus]